MKRLPKCYICGKLMLAAAALWLAAAPATAQDVPFTAVVYEDEVTIRSGAGRAYYSVGTLEKGERVVVEELFHGWNKIKPPEGVYSYISKAYVNAEGDGSTGVVNRDRAEVKAANVKGPGTLSYRIIKELDKGETVRIVAEENGWYKIEPVEGTYVYLEPGSVRRASTVNGATEPLEPREPTEPTEPVEPTEPTEPTEPSEPTPPAEPTEPLQSPTEPVEPTEPAEPTEPQEAPTEPAEPTEPVEPAEPTEPIEPTEPLEPTEPGEPAEPLEPGDGGEEPIDLSQGKGESQPIAIAESDDLATVDQQMLPLFEKPLEEQPIDRMTAAYRKFQGDESLSPTDNRLVRLRLAALQHNKKVLAAIRRTDQTLAEIKAEREKQEKIDANTFDAVGILRASNIYDGKNMPRMYRLVDPSTQRAKAYLRPTDALDAGATLGKLVGVRGPTSVDPAAKLTVIEPTRVTVLEAMPE